MVLVGAGTFFAQAAATGFVSRAATTDRGSASGIYLASYFMGGLAGSAILGVVFDQFGWPACVAGIGLALAVAAVFTLQLEPRATPPDARSISAIPLHDYTQLTTISRGSCRFAADRRCYTAIIKTPTSVALQIAHSLRLSNPDPIDISAGAPHR